MMVHQVRVGGGVCHFPVIATEKINVENQSDYGLYTMICSEVLGAGFGPQERQAAKAEWRKRYPEPTLKGVKTWAEAAHRHAHGRIG